MLIEEAKWFNRKIHSMDNFVIFPMLNAGSSTDKFRRINQPYIDEYIFKPIRRKNQPVKHLDIKQAPGVDIVGDFTDTNFLSKLSKMNFKSVFCANLLEHVTNREEIARILVTIIPVGGYIFVSCPFKYPKHHDPIDTMFRPTVQELANLFPNTEIVYGAVILSGNTYFGYLLRNPIILVKTSIRIFMPFYKPTGWLTNINKILWLFKKFQITCLVLRKNSEKG